MEYVQNFNAEFRKSAKISDLDEYLGFIRTMDDLIGDKLSLNVTYFFVNLYNFMDKHFTGPGQNSNISTVRHCFCILENIVKDPRSRRIFVNEFNYLPILSAVLTNFPNERATILKILLKMSYDINVVRHETYLNNLIDQLVSIIGEDLEEARLALCVLLNLCKGPGPARTVLLQTVKFSEFTVRVKQHGFFASKLLMILGADADRSARFGPFLQEGLSEVQKAIQTFDVTALRQIVGLMICNEININEVSFNESLLNQLLTSISSRLSMDDNHSESLEEEKSCCMNLLFKLILFLLNLNFTSQEFVNRTLELALDWVGNVVAGPIACAVLTKLIRRWPHVIDDIKIKIYSLEDNFSKRKDLALASIKLIIACLSTPPRPIVSDNVLQPEIFTQLLDSIPCAHDSTDEDIQFFVYTLRLLQLLSYADPLKYSEVFSNQVKLDRTAIVLAKALMLKDHELLIALFSLTREQDLPISTIAQNAVLNNDSQKTFASVNNNNSGSAIIKPNPSLMGKLDGLLLKVSSLDNNETKGTAHNILSKEMVLAYQIKIQIISDENTSLESNIKDLEKLNCNLRHQKSLLMAQSAQMDSINQDLTEQIDQLHKTQQILEEENESVKLATNHMSLKLEKKKKILADMQCRLNTNQIEMSALQRKIKEVEMEKEKFEELKRFQETRIEEYRNKMKEFELDIQNFQATLKGKNEQIEKHTLKIGETEKENQRLKRLVQDLQSEVTSQDKKIKQLTDELQESEQRWQMVMNIMGNKKSKK